MISVVILTKNEEKNIKDCFKSVKWCDEIVVIDDYSEDKTVEIAKNLGATVFERRLEGDFSAQRNFGLERAKGEWVLFVDADERVTPKLRAEISRLYLSETDKNGFYFKRKDWFGNKWLKHGETARVRLLRLARKGTGKWKRKVHETWEIEGQTGELRKPILHYSYSDFSQFLKKINAYSSLHAQALQEESVKPNPVRIIINPLGKFIQNYLFRLGFLDGTPGFMMAMMMSFHSFLAQAKLYQLWKK